MTIEIAVKTPLPGDSLVTINASKLYRKIGKRIQKARKHQRMTQATLGSWIGMERTSLVGIEAGTQYAPLHTLCLIYKVLGLRPSGLVTKRFDI